MQTFLQLLISGLAMGFIYALVSVEYTIIWNASGLINFAHDKLILLGAYIFGAQFVIGMGLSYGLSVPLMIVAMFIFGAVMSYVVYRPLRKLPTVFSVTGTIMFGRIIVEAVRIIWGNAPIPIVGWLSGIIKTETLTVNTVYLVIIAVSIVLVAALQFFLQKTKTGTAMRCVAQNKTAASLMGIDVERSSALTLAISAVICGIIGILIIPLFQLKGTMTGSIGLKGFAAGVVGGFGYLPGGILGGILIGVLESLSTMFVPGIYKDIVSFILLVIVLLIKPSGILGHKARG